MVAGFISVACVVGCGKWMSISSRKTIASKASKSIQPGLKVPSKMAEYIYHIVYLFFFGSFKPTKFCKGNYPVLWLLSSCSRTELQHLQRPPLLCRPPGTHHERRHRPRTLQTSVVIAPRPRDRGGWSAMGTEDGAQFEKKTGATAFFFWGGWAGSKGVGFWSFAIIHWFAIFDFFLD